MVQFNLAGQTTSSGYLSIGFGPNGKMASADIITATVFGGTLTIVDNRSGNGYLAPSLDLPDVGAISNVTGSVTATGWMSVSFRRKRITGASIDMDLGPSCKPYKFTFALGTTFFNQHPVPGASNGPYVSENFITICDTAEVAATPCTLGSSAIIVHSAMMLVAWLIISPAGSLIARYLKNQLPPPRWFELHRGLQVIASLLTLIGFALAYMNGRRSPETKLHAQVGLAVFIATMAQALLGFTRNIIAGFDHDKPRFVGDKGPRRWIFNWLHWLIGRSLLPVSCSCHVEYLSNPSFILII